MRNNGSLASFKHCAFKSFLAEQKAAMFLNLYIGYIRLIFFGTGNIYCY